MTRTRLYQESVVLPEGWHTGVFRDIVEGESTYGPNLRFVADVSLEDGSSVEVSTITTDLISAGSRGGKLVEGLLGRKPGPGESIDFDKFVGIPVDVKVEPRVTDKGTFNNLSEVRPRVVSSVELPEAF